MDDNNRIKAELKEITEKLEQGIKGVFESDKYKEYLNTMSKFYNYSFNNTMLIAMQKPDATLITGYNAWKDKFDRHVRKGEKGIRIIAPAPIRTKEEAEKLDPITQEPMLDEKGKPIMEVVEITTPSYKVIPVFDVSQTDGKPLPDLGVEELNGAVKDYEIFMEALTQTSPVPIGYEEIPDGAKGYYHLEEKRIAIQEEMSEIQTVKTAIHEISHATLHDLDSNVPDADMPEKQKKDRKTKEVEAESIAYTVCQHYGIDTSDYSFGYVAGWSSDKELRELRSSLETIRKTSAALINAIDAKVAELQAAKEVPLSKEAMLLYGKEDSFGIYQLKHGDELHYHHFESLESLEKHNLSVQKDNYELIYTASLKEGQTLDDIFEEFNLFRPDDFAGHSLSVSDIIMVHKAGENSAQYVDAMGFKEISDFLDQELPIEQEITSELTKTSTPEQKVKDVEALSFGDVVHLYNGGKSVDIIDEQTIQHASWRRDIKGLDASTGEMVKFNANEIEAINFSNGSIADRDEDNFISHFYVIEDIDARLYKLTKYEDYPSAREAYFALPFDKKKALGVQNTRGGSLDFIQCKDGDDTPIMDCRKIEDWNTPAIYSLLEQIQIDVILYGEKELAYEFADRYLMLQECDEGYDYTFYDKDYKLMDGGVYDNPDIMLHEALHIILTDDPFQQGERKVIDYRELEEKVDAVNAIVPLEKVADELKQSLTFYVAECSEYPNLGEYHENLTLDEAVELYESIPSERMNAGKGIGFTLRDVHEPEDAFADMQFDILSGKVIDVDIINHIPEFRESALVQQAVKDMIERFPDAKVWDRETREREAQEAAQNFDKDCEVLAVDLDQFSEDYDTYEYNNAVEDKEENVRNIYQWLQSGETEHIATWLNEVIEDEEPKEDVEKATGLLSRLDDIVKRREKNPLTKVEELEEANYNQIDGMLNNSKAKVEEKKEEKLSIMEKLLENKDKVMKQNGYEKVAKEVEKKEILMD